MDSGRQVKETKPKDGVKIKRPGEAEDPNLSVQFSSVQLLNCIQLFATPWTPVMLGFPVYHQLPELT